MESEVNWCAALGTVLANEEVSALPAGWTDVAGQDHAGHGDSPVVVVGLSERGDHPVTRVKLRQWQLRITEYAPELEAELALLMPTAAKAKGAALKGGGEQGAQDEEAHDSLLAAARARGWKEGAWPAGTVAAQREWIGRSEGAMVSFELVWGEGVTEGSAAGSEQEGEEISPGCRGAHGQRGGLGHVSLHGVQPAGTPAIECFTTRVDTLFGVEAVVLAPTHPVVSQLLAEQQQEPHEHGARSPHGAALAAYVRAAAPQQAQQGAAAASAGTAGKSGVFTGAYVAHPLTGETVPLYVRCSQSRARRFIS